MGEISVTYRTAKIVHYGGEFTAPLIANHPTLAEKILRYAEPVDDLNPVVLEFHGLDQDAAAAFRERMQHLLYSESFCYAHGWQQVIS